MRRIATRVAIGRVATANAIFQLRGKYEFPTIVTYTTSSQSVNRCFTLKTTPVCVFPLFSFGENIVKNRAKLENVRK
jgi:hypothetical protein